MSFLNLILALLMGVQAPSPSIEGRVVDAATGIPLAGVRVGTTPVLSRAIIHLPSPAAGEITTTDSLGKFRLGNIPQGRYRVWADHDGYARREFGSSISGESGQQTGTVFEFEAGQPVQGITIPLLRSGSVSGRIASSTGEPLVGIQVILLRRRYSSEGPKVLETESSVWTNDRGEYRMAGIGPGDYYLLARSEVKMMPTEAQSAFGNTAPEPSPGLYPATFFPGTGDLERAAVIKVTAGIHANADLVLVRANGYRIRGRVLEEATGKPPVSVGFSLFPRPPIGPFIIGTMYGPGYNRIEGTFDVTFPGSPNGFPPGSYWLVVTRTTIANEPPLVGIEGRLGARLAVTLGEADLENLEVLIRKPVSLTGSVAVEGQQTSEFDLRGIQISLVPRTDRPWKSTSGAPRSQHTPIGRDGRFVYENLAPDSYDVIVDKLPPAAYVRAVNFGDVDVLTNPLVVSGSSTDVLKVVISPIGFRLDGTLRDSKLQPVPNQQVVLVPDGQGKRPDLYRTTTSNDRGKFTIAAIAPGEYRLFAWEEIEPFAYFDSEILARFEQQGVLIKATSGSSQSVDLSLTKTP